MDAEAKIKEATIEAVVIRADGSREDLGVVSSLSDGTITLNDEDDRDS